MIYQLLRGYAAIGIKFFYKNIFVNTAMIDVDKPLIFASNHPNGFYESIILTTIVKKPVYFLVRADYVNIKGLKWIFDIVKLYPIYRQSEGLKDVNKNKTVFSELNSKLKNRSYVAIYPEGSTKFQYYIPAIKKGVARLATGAVISGVEDLKVVPVGFNFNAPHKFGSFLNVNFNNWIDIDREEVMSMDSPVYIRQLTNEIREGMRTVAFHFENRDRGLLFSKLLEIIINNHKPTAKSSYIFNSELPAITKTYSLKIDAMPPSKYKELENTTLEYFNILKKEKIDDEVLLKDAPGLWSMIKYYAGLIFFIPFAFLNILPVLPSIYLYKKVVKQLEYKAVISVLTAQILYVVYFFILLIVALFLFGYYGLVVLILPFTALYAMQYYKFYRDFVSYSGYKKSPVKDKLKNLRGEIIKKIE